MYSQGLKYLPCLINYIHYISSSILYSTSRFSTVYWTLWHSFHSNNRCNFLSIKFTFLYFLYQIMTRGGFTVSQLQIQPFWLLYLYLDYFSPLPTDSEAFSLEVTRETVQEEKFCCQCSVLMQQALVASMAFPVPGWSATLAASFQHPLPPPQYLQTSAVDLVSYLYQQFFPAHYRTAFWQLHQHIIPATSLSLVDHGGGIGRDAESGYGFFLLLKLLSCMLSQNALATLMVPLMHCVWSRSSFHSKGYTVISFYLWN